MKSSLALVLLLALGSVAHADDPMPTETTPSETADEAGTAGENAAENTAEALENQMQKRQSELVKPIMDRINTVLQDVRKEGGYTLILDAAAGSIVAADPAMDLTETVLTRLKASSPAAAAAPAGPKKP